MNHKDFLLQLISPTAQQGGGGTPATLINKNVSANGTYNASSDNADGYKKVVVAVQPDLQSKSVNITENGTTNVAPDQGKDGLSGVEITVNVSGGGGEATVRGLLDGSLTGALSDNVITAIREHVCDGITGLTGASFPEVTDVKSYAFQNCTSLASISFPKVVSLWSNAFYGCTVLQDSVFPKLAQIGNSAFYGCKALTKVNGTYFPALATADSVYINGSAFYGCDHITEVDLPAKVQSLSGSTFYNCTRLTSATFMGKTFGSSEFRGCTALAHVSVPNLESVSGSAFNSCSSLQSIELPSLRTINGQYLFENCTSLKRVTFGPNLSSVYQGTFKGCSAIEAIVFPSSAAVVPLASTSAFAGSSIASGTGYIYVPDALVSSWKTASNWSTYANQIKPLSELPT